MYQLPSNATGSFADLRVRIYSYGRWYLGIWKHDTKMRRDNFLSACKDLFIYSHWCYCGMLFNTLELLVDNHNNFMHALELGSTWYSSCMVILFGEYNTLFLMFSKMHLTYRRYKLTHVMTTNWNVKASGWFYD